MNYPDGALAETFKLEGSPGTYREPENEAAQLEFNSVESLGSSDSNSDDLLRNINFYEQVSSSFDDESAPPSSPPPSVDEDGASGDKSESPKEEKYKSLKQRETKIISSCELQQPLRCASKESSYSSQQSEALDSNNCSNINGRSSNGSDNSEINHQIALPPVNCVLAPRNTECEGLNSDINTFSKNIYHKFNQVDGAPEEGDEFCATTYQPPSDVSSIGGGSDQAPEQRVMVLPQRQSLRQYGQPRDMHQYVKHVPIKRRCKDENEGRAFEPRAKREMIGIGGADSLYEAEMLDATCEAIGLLLDGEKSITTSAALVSQ